MPQSFHDPVKITGIILRIDELYHIKPVADRNILSVDPKYLRHTLQQITTCFPRLTIRFEHYNILGIMEFIHTTCFRCALQIGSNTIMNYRQLLLWTHIHHTGQITDINRYTSKIILISFVLFNNFPKADTGKTAHILFQMLIRHMHCNIVHNNEQWQNKVSKSPAHRCHILKIHRYHNDRNSPCKNKKLLFCNLMTISIEEICISQHKYFCTDQ